MSDFTLKCWFWILLFCFLKTHYVNASCSSNVDSNFWTLPQNEDYNISYFLKSNKNNFCTCEREMPGPVHEVNIPFRKATFGMGCFWACDALFGGTPGVIRTRVGYSGGTTKDPSYKNIGDHTEVIEIHYDPKVVTYKELLRLFWDNHEYGITTKIKRQYMSTILYHDEDQKKIAEISLKEETHKLNEEPTTVIQPAGAFYDAEDYHQKYRLQQHKWLCEELQLTPKLLKTSCVAAKLNGFLAGVGSAELLERECITLGLSDSIIDFVRNVHDDNEGGSLYC